MHVTGIRIELVLHDWYHDSSFWQVATDLIKLITSHDNHPKVVLVITDCG